MRRVKSILKGFVVERFIDSVVRLLPDGRRAIFMTVEPDTICRDSETRAALPWPFLLMLWILRQVLLQKLLLPRSMRAVL